MFDGDDDELLLGPWKTVESLLLSVDLGADGQSELPCLPDVLHAQLYLVVIDERVNLSECDQRDLLADWQLHLPVCCGFHRQSSCRATHSKRYLDEAQIKLLTLQVWGRIERAK